MKPDFEITLWDGSVQTSEVRPWSEIGELERVQYAGGTKTVSLLRLPATKVLVRCEDLETEIEIPEGCRAYYAIRSETLLLPQGERKVRDLGKVVGLVKDGSVIEERFLDIVGNRVLGLKL